MERIVFDDDLGKLVIRVNPRARRFIFRTKSDAIYISVPPRSTQKELQRAIEDLREKLTESRKKIASPVLIDLHYNIDAEFFKLRLIEGTKDRFMVQYQAGATTLVCPAGTDFNNPELQQWLRKVIAEMLRRNAATILPSRLAELSRQFKLPFQSVKINSSQSRWGSCSTRKNINLSYYLLLLPGHLIDYVLLHELCHTREMNHSEKFWALMGAVTHGKQQALREELKGYKTEI